MLACIYNDEGKMELTEKEKPRAKQDTAVIRVLATSICGTDFRTYVYGSGKISPGTTLGHEMCGEIVDIGSGVEGFSLGDIVTVTPALGCGQCRMCKKGHTNMCDNLETLGFQYDGSFAEYMEIPARFFEMDSVNHVPDGVAHADAALAEPIACAVNAQEFLHIEQGDYVAIFGSGFIGCMHAELAFASGADKVIMIEPNEARRAAASELVPNICMLAGGEKLVEQVMELTDGRGVDVAIVACSVGAAQTDAMKIAGKRGRVSLFGGLPGDGCGFIDSNIIHYKELGVYGVHASTTLQNKKALAWIEQGKIDAGKFITRKYPLSDILEALEDIRTKGIMKAVISFE
ncbi:MAG: alcohol dehydrogenase catalytic domain-containing protein [Christensenella sp.]|uniref:alcohol dehydrogenase catalytic domain-containing protein n=1 Tax=Christensenella sp. TaxID=1935934 RepID=UPI002B1F78D3|nr:alcohol dehydrogenase catalytic domain-containing protein [Christensenella sp.]MEA5003726.1 alcohol dehydrogenase catalytic domain-containing protein [Christensenella sp.]